MRHLDLFAGIGGFHAAVSHLGGETVAAVESNYAVANAYKEMWGLEALGDVVDYHKSWDVDLITAGFPCQPFSKAGKQLGSSDDRGTLFDVVLEFIDESYCPPVVMLENVPNLRGKNHITYWNHIKDSLAVRGYTMSEGVLSPHLLPIHLGGTPHHRPRLFLLAVKDGFGLEPELDIPQEAWNDAAYRNWWAAQKDRSPDEHSVPTDVTRTYISTYREELTKFRGPIPKGVLYLADHLELPESRRKIEWQAGDSPFEECCVQLRPSGARFKHFDYLPALVASNQKPFIIGWDRYITAKEGARLQGLPNLPLSMTETEKWKALGNSVNAMLVYNILRKVF